MIIGPGIGVTSKMEEIEVTLKTDEIGVTPKKDGIGVTSKMADMGATSKTDPGKDLAVEQGMVLGIVWQHSRRSTRTIVNIAAEKTISNTNSGFSSTCV
jgi:hypothetical protein